MRWYAMWCTLGWDNMLGYLELVCVCVRVCIEDSVLEDLLIKLGCGTQWVEVGLWDMGDWVPKTF